jgi:hypothetical protein
MKKIDAFDNRIIIMAVLLGLVLVVIFIVLRPAAKEPVAPPNVVVTRNGDKLTAEVQRPITEEEKSSLADSISREFGAEEVEIEVARPYTQEGEEFLTPRIDPEYIEREINPGPGDAPGSDAGADYGL